MSFLKKIVLILLLFLLTGCASDASQSAGTKPDSVYIENKGSDTIVNLALAWAERYQQVKPAIRISVTGGGSGTGIASLINKTVDIANASREIKSEEIENAQKAGVNPYEIIIARDAIAVIVNPANPIDRLSLEQIAAIYNGSITNWSEVGGEDRPIVRLSRESNSGTHVYFLEAVVRLGNKDDKTIFSPNTLLLPSSEGIIAEVSDNPNAIGYDGLGYITPNVKTLAISPKGSSEYYLPSIESVNDGTYPISRDLYMYTNGSPQGEIKTYIDWILSDEAQIIVSDLGFVPVIKIKGLANESVSQ